MRPEIKSTISESIQKTILDTLGNRIKYINGHKEKVFFTQGATKDIRLVTDSGMMRVGFGKNNNDHYLKISEVKKGHFSNAEKTGINIKGQCLEIPEDQFIEIWNRK